MDKENCDAIAVCNQIYCTADQAGAGPLEAAGRMLIFKSTRPGPSGRRESACDVGLDVATTTDRLGMTLTAITAFRPIARPEAAR
jgi:hypothetical protein